MKVSTGKSQVRSGDTGVRGELVVQLVGALTDREGDVVFKRSLNQWQYDVEQETHPESGLNVPVVYKKRRDYPANEGDENAHKNSKGEWVITVDRKRYDPDPEDAQDLEGRYGWLFDTTVYLQCKVIWPEEFFGEVIPLSVTVKGIEFPDGPNEDNVHFVTQVERGNISRFMQVCMDFGFQPAKLRSDGPLYDPNYLEPFASNCTLPYTPEQIVERLLVPLLVRHGHEGHLVSCRTSDKSHFIVGQSTSPVPDADAKRFWEKARQIDDADPQEDPAPFPGDDAKSVVEDEAQAEKLKGHIRSMVADGVFKPLDLCDLLDGWAVSYEDESILSSLNVSTLARIVEHYAPASEESELAL